MIRVKAHKERKELYHAHKLLAKNLRLLRSLRGVSQERIARMLNMSRSAYSCLENGSKIPDFVTVCKLSDFYQVSLDYVLSFDLSKHILSLLKDETGETDALRFIEHYQKLSYGAQKQVAVRIRHLLEEEKQFNHFPWDYKRGKK